MPADYDGDGRANIGVFRPSTGVWYILSVRVTTYGASCDIPVPADYNRDGKADLAVFRPSTGVWYILGVGSMTYGINGDVPVPADYNGDGKAEIAVFRPATGDWYIFTVRVVRYGTIGDVPVPRDYDGDNRADAAVFRPSEGKWYQLLARGATVAAYWHMDEPAASTTMSDSSGHGNNGRVHNVVTGARGLSNRSYYFRQGSIVSVPSAPSLNPGSRNFSFTVNMLTTARIPPGAETPNVMQKGRFDTAGGQYKLQLLPRPGASWAECDFHGSASRLSIAGGPNVADGRWHRIVCAKYATSVTLQVDGGTIYRATGTAGSISNNDELTLGAPSLGNEDQYLGQLDEVRVVIAP